MRDIISRFAPAPTGFLHLGHVVNAACVWREARARGGRVLLRIEDHDRLRSRREYEAEILDDLAWLGFEADAPPVRQSERGQIYEAALDALRRRGLVYACNCSRAEIATAGLKACATGTGSSAPSPVGQPTGVPVAPSFRAADATAGLNACATGTGSSGPSPVAQSSGVPVAPPFRAADEELRYPGTCRDRGLVERPGLGLRVRLEPTVERFVDLRHGLQEQRPSEQCGDLLVRDRDGNWTYQFAATVDDYVQGVTLVIRGDDLLPSTGRQIQLARLLGRREPPEFLHHPLIMKSSQQKLSKSDNDSGIRELRAGGWTPEQVIARALSLVGDRPSPAVD
jgi:glutamyl/glutaminyl-tRNA synthetase